VKKKKRKTRIGSSHLCNHKKRKVWSKTIRLSASIFGFFFKRAVPSLTLCNILCCPSQQTVE
jgi:hypothetical protein